MTAAASKSFSGVTNDLYAAHLFLLKYTTAVLVIFSGQVAAMRFGHDKTGVVPFVIAIVFYYFTPFLMCSVPLVFALVAGVAWGRNILPYSTKTVKVLLGLLAGTLYFTAGSVIVFVVFKILYSRW